MDLSKLPIFKFHQQYLELTKVQKRIFEVLFGVLVVLSGLLIYNFHNPGAWCLTVKSVPYSNTEEVVVTNADNFYRSFNYFAHASYSYINYMATHIQPSIALTSILAFGLILGWSALLAASSRIEGFMGYVIYFFHACFLYFADFGSLFGGSQYPMLFASIIIIPFIALSYAFKIRFLKWAAPVQFGIFIALHFLLYLISYVYDGWAGVHMTSASSVPIITLIAILFTLFIGKEFNTLVVFWATNKNKTEKRKNGIITGGVILAFILIQALVTAREFALISLPFPFIRPMHLWIIASILTIFLSQIFWVRSKDKFTTAASFIMSLLGWAIISTVTWVYFYGAMEYSYMREMNKIIGLILLLVSIFHLIYIYANYWKVFSLKGNVYAILALPKTIGIEAIFFSSLAILALVQGNASWMGYHSVGCAYRNAKGDTQLLKGDKNDARNYYRISGEFFGDDVKPNFNLAALLVEDEKYLESNEVANQIASYYKSAYTRFPFEPAMLNLGSYYSLIGEPIRTHELYEEILKPINGKIPKYARVCSNLAKSYFGEKKNKEALEKIKIAIELDPDNGELYSNMALLYQNNDQPKEAIKAINYALKLDNRDPFIIENNYFLKLYNRSEDEKWEVSEPIDYSRQNYWSNMNKAIIACKLKKNKLADEICTRLLKQEKTPEVSLLKILTQIQMDSLDNAKSRIDFIGETNKAYQTIGMHNLGVYYFEKSVPEMAAYYFEKSAKNDFLVNQLSAAFMYIDAGNDKLGYERLVAFRDSFPQLADQLNREISLLDYGFGLEKSMLSWDFNDITYYENMRGASYAARGVKDLQIIESFLQPVVDKDSSRVTAHIKIGEIYIAFGNLKFARMAYKLGLDRQPENIELNAGMAKVDYLEGKKQAALDRLKKIKEQNSIPVLRCYADFAILNQDYKEAEKKLLQILKVDFLNKKAIIELSKLYLVQKKYKEGLDFLTHAIKYNNQNDEFWYYFAEFNKKMGSDDWAVDAYKSSIELGVNAVNINRSMDSLKVLEDRISQRSNMEE